ncbi:8156_t:CDS:2 [Cetraspora pellucida]|uniref:8156_t:CDS:1 n=1 Tax=Cetraspora pellucida TaxID=1433469 RepID=A0ACA9L0X0_9GLOM|nr:8156_t:CDS:2 [Cetraspora pellucida]
MNEEAYISQKPLTEEEKHKEQEFFSKTEIKEANLQHKPSLIVQQKINLEADLEAKKIDLASIILGAKNKNKAIQENYSKEEISEIIKLAIDAYRASDKGKSKKFEAGMTEKQVQEILNAINNSKFLIRVKFIRDDSVYGDKSQTKIALNY